MNTKEQKILEIVEKLINLGIYDSQWDHITDGLRLLKNKLESKEISIYGKVRSKKELKAELDLINRKMAELEEQLNELK